MRLYNRFIFLLLPLLLFSACKSIQHENTISAVQNDGPDIITESTATTAATVLPVYAEVTEEGPPKVKYIWLDSGLPEAVRDLIEFDEGLLIVDSYSDAEAHISIAGKGKPTFSTTDWVYVVAARFPTIQEDIPYPDLKLLWSGDRTDHILLMDEDTKAVLSTVWGEPTGHGVEVFSQGELLTAAWEHPEAFAIIPFDQIEPRWKVLAVDGMDPFDKTMDVRNYPLRITVGVMVEPGYFLDARTIRLPKTNREAEKIISLNMTGVTALVRGTARMMNERGVLFPARDVGSLLASADLTHISNEVSFNLDCDPQRAASPEGIFCSTPAYIQLLKAVGVDIVELTGNHNMDKGSNAYLYSLDQYRQLGWEVYGGGIDIEHAKRPLLIERGETRLAFIGCNWAGPEIAWAGQDSPGAAPCEMDWLLDAISRARLDGFLPIVTYQAFETEDYFPAPMQRPTDFLRASQAGAVIVSGSQAHFPQGFKFDQDRFIHYGLGNLFFDQMQPPATRRSTIDRHIFYKDKYLGVDIIPIKLEDSARPRLMSESESQEFLEKLFEVSGWPVQ